ncbi:MAG: 30S ribosomal protein S21 [Patescibacteria group bacterium]|nr:30S ribosomal protein S21 [Patescibacteria group bacterium]
MLEVKRKDGESFESLIRRFTKKTIQSGKILQAKKVRFFTKEKSKRALKEGALRRNKIGTKMDYLKRIGKLEDFGGFKKGKSNKKR